MNIDAVRLLFSNKVVNVRAMCSNVLLLNEDHFEAISTTCHLCLERNKSISLIPSLCFQQLQSRRMFSHFAKTCQRLSLGELWKAATTNAYKHVGATANVTDWDADKYSKNAKFAFKDAAPLLDLLNPQAGLYLKR